MPETPAQPVTNAREGAWTLPGGKNGLQGTPAAVAKAISELSNLPEHGKTTLREAILASLEGTEHNFVTVHASANRHEIDGQRHDIFHVSIRSTQKLL